MTRFSTKTAALTAVMALGFLTSPAHADNLRSTNGELVHATDGGCVITEWQGSVDCNIGAAVAATQTVDRERIVYFDFNKATLDAQSKKHLAHLAHKLHWMGKHDNAVETITAVGFADRIGDADYNQKLAMRRAEAVRSFLVGKGIKANKIQVESLGKTEPKADCPADLPRKKLIACLREDRRVEITVTETPKK
ncbi:MAG: OmpA family protein [Alphaproteobacteria bacterium]|nr:OmpA family protein [Alphaproteobacteria bacterium]